MIYFDKQTLKELKHYVYRLVDPRNGHTFYIGKGQGNRVFHHAKAAEKELKELMSKDEKENQNSLKMQIIKEIIAGEQEIITIIHRHVMDKDAAFEVESALIDAGYPLTNEVRGHFTDRAGCVHTTNCQNVWL